MQLLVIILMGIGSVISSNDSNSFWDLELAPDSEAPIPYLNVHLTVWKHSYQNRYFVRPLALLLEDTATSTTDLFHEGQFLMEFKVRMWSEEMKETVYKALKKRGRKVTKRKVEMVPMEEVRLVWKDSFIQSMNDKYTLDQKWIPNRQLDKELVFKFICKNSQDCKLLADEMKNNPDAFRPIDVQYVVNGQKSSRRKITITGEQISQGNLFTRLENLNGGRGEERFLKSADVKILTEETMSSVRASIVTDSGYVESKDEVSLKDLLNKELEKQKTSSANFDQTQWNSTFWDPGYARPDKVTRTLNKYVNVDKEDNAIVDDKAVGNSKDINVGATLQYSGFDVDGSHEQNSVDSQSVNLNDVLNTFKKKDSEIEYTGEMFVAKLVRY
ncbi:uncharacterized protein LOC142352915 [Convolutriloba macropyga]|uniref:uncharacterized protein LOC142352915 n=1 Tax=Convolutriloba macropyga TaxID=536237 RepID=UPI003F524A27